MQKTSEVLECQPIPSVATVTDATPPPNYVVFAPAWSVDGVSRGFAASGLFSLTPGAHLVQASVQDLFGALDLDSFVVDVLPDDAPPVFTFVPADISTSSCAGLHIGLVTASDNCGEVVVTNDAPAHLGAGTTVVTWTARDGAGNTVTATQTVTATLKNDASFCPTGSNVILGTSNNNSLVGTSGPDCILGFGGQDQIDGGGGNDVIRAVTATTSCEPAQETIWSGQALAKISYSALPATTSCQATTATTRSAVKAGSTRSSAVKAKQRYPERRGWRRPAVRRGRRRRARRRRAQRPVHRRRRLRHHAVLNAAGYTRKPRAALVSGQPELRSV